MRIRSLMSVRNLMSALAVAVLGAAAIPQPVAAKKSVALTAFIAQSPKSGWGVYVSDGTSAGTSELIAGSKEMLRLSAYPVGDKSLLLVTNDALRVSDQTGLYVLTRSGKLQKLNHPLIENLTEARAFAPVRGRLYVVNNGKLISTDGTQKGTREISAAPFYSVTSVFEFNGRTSFISSLMNTTEAFQIIDEATASSSVLFLMPRQGGRGSYSEPPTLFGDKLILTRRTDASGYEPWVSDGTAEGTDPQRYWLS
ncbi:hypothetical protein [Chenggangzhangella methanolivorans]|uniref:Uncharacterized protein n=1 Tax=Chenggangzhangella methanolivorans TaxID=1437009 RepID=A0A9E6UH98_9HYPH|nr:hypothetical protein [Chenggangzhangella methanolivorans]QZN99567.1 hypothetical protein K6K41_23125 [Chenggangzhangella methanolivorans]